MHMPVMTVIMVMMIFLLLEECFRKDESKSVPILASMVG